MRQLNMIDDLGFLLESFAPKKVTVHSNSETEWERFDREQLESMGYKRGDTVKYSIKQGKTTLCGNPYMHSEI